MKFLPAVLLALAATPLHAQDALTGASRGIAVDLGLGAAIRPSFPGSDEHVTRPWLIWRNLQLGTATIGGEPPQGWSFAPSWSLEDARDADDHARLTGLSEIDRTVELGVMATYTVGAASTYASLRKGLGGHGAVTGEAGMRYRLEASDRLTVWAGLEAGYGDEAYNQTWFGVTADEADASGLEVFSPGGGVNSAAATLEARFAVTDSVAVLGEVRYSTLIGDAADSPVVLDKAQPSLRLGIVRSLNFGF